MKAIVLHQPWATLVALGIKTWETRPAPPNGPMRPDGVRGLPGLAIEPGERIAIVAGKRAPDRGLDMGGWRVMRAAHDGRYELWGPSTPIAGTGWPPQRECAAYFLPRGVVVCTVRVAEVLPITTYADTGDPECIVVHDGQALDWCIPSWHADQPEPDPHVIRLDAPEIPDGAHLIRGIDDQLPYGDWQPGRWAWRLDNVERTEPIPVKGRQGVFELECQA